MYNVNIMQETFRKVSMNRPDYGHRVVFVPVQWRWPKHIQEKYKTPENFKKALEDNCETPDSIRIVPVDGVEFRMTLTARHGVFGWPFCAQAASNSIGDINRALLKAIRQAKLTKRHIVALSTYRHLDTIVAVGTIDPEYTSFGKPSRTKAMFHRRFYFTPKEEFLVTHAWRILITPTEYIEGGRVAWLAWKHSGLGYVLEPKAIRSRMKKHDDKCVSSKRGH